MSEEPKKDPFEKLPLEIHQLILTKVDKATLLRCRLLSRNWRTQTDDVLHSQEKSVWVWKSYDPQTEATRNDEFMEESRKLRRVGCVYVKGREAMEDFGKLVVDGFPYADDNHSVFNAGHQGPFPSGSAIYNVIHEWDEAGNLIKYPELITPSFGRFLTSFSFLHGIYDSNFGETPMTRIDLVQLLSRIPNVKFLKLSGFLDKKKEAAMRPEEQPEIDEGYVEVEAKPQAEIPLPELPSLETLILFDPENDTLINLLLNQYGHQLRHLEFYDGVGFEMPEPGVFGLVRGPQFRDRSYFEIEAVTPLQEKMTSLKDLKVELSLPLGATIKTHNIPLLERLCLEINYIQNFSDFDLFPCLQLLNQFHASLKVFSLLMYYPINSTAADHMGNPVEPYDHSQWDLEYNKYNREQKKLMDQSFPVLEQITVPADLARNSPAFWALMRKGGSTLKEVELVGWEYQPNPPHQKLQEIMAQDLEIVTAFFNRIWNDYPSVERIKIHLKELHTENAFRGVFIATRKMFDEGKEIFRAMYNLNYLC